jgi:hypothetical protein
MGTEAQICHRDKFPATLKNSWAKARIDLKSCSVSEKKFEPVGISEGGFSDLGQFQMEMDSNPFTDSRH